MQGTEGGEGGSPPTANQQGAEKLRGEVLNQFDAPNASFLGRGDTFEEWLSGLSGERTLNFVHLELPHVPYEFYPDGRRYAGACCRPTACATARAAPPTTKRSHGSWNRGCCCRPVSPTCCWAG